MCVWCLDVRPLRARLAMRFALLAPPPPPRPRREVAELDLATAGLPALAAAVAAGGSVDAAAAGVAGLPPGPVAATAAVAHLGAAYAPPGFAWNLGCCMAYWQMLSRVGLAQARAAPSRFPFPVRA